VGFRRQNLITGVEGHYQKLSEPRKQRPRAFRTLLDG
jgi:hypothetical protein